MSEMSQTLRELDTPWAEVTQEGLPTGLLSSELTDWVYVGDMTVEQFLYWVEQGGVLSELIIEEDDS